MIEATGIIIIMFCKLEVYICKRWFCIKKKKKEKKEAKRASAVKKIEKRLKLMITGPEREREDWLNKTEKKCINCVSF